MEETRREERKDAARVLHDLREAQNLIISAAWYLDDDKGLLKALTIIGDAMDGISAEYDLPIMSEQ